MTKETLKRLYNLYKENGNKVALADILKGYPALEGGKLKVKEVPKEVPTKEVKSGKTSKR